MKDDIKQLKLTVKLRLRENGDEALPDSVVYVYDTNGGLLAAREVPSCSREDVTVELPMGLRGRTVRVLAGPSVRVKGKDDRKAPEWMAASLRTEGRHEEAPPLTMVRRAGAVERSVRLEDSETTARLQVFRVDWQRWFTCQCVVRGRLVKKVPMPDGTVQDWGVCHACVLIWEVDRFPYIIARLPDFEVFRLRDELLREIQKWPPEPPREWPPTPPVPPGPRPMAAKGSAAADTPPAAPSAMVESIVLASSASQLRQALIAQGSILVRWLCAWPWFMRYVGKDLLTWTCTDDRGYFETTVNYPCAGDHPDLYFQAIQWIGGSFHSLYDPGMICHTHWNYVCGTEVQLVTDDPAAIVCAPPDPVDPPPGVGTWVLINRVGGILIDSIGLDGLVGYDFVGPDGHVSASGAPFGATLGLRASHSPDIPTAQIRYYRWLWHKDDDVDEDGDPIWHEFATPLAPHVGRHYADYDLTQPSQPPTFPIYTLGPKSVTGKLLYEFRPQPSELQDQAPPDHAYQWPVEAIGNDIYSAKLASRDLPGGAAAAHGLYWFKLEVFDEAGDQVHPGAGTFEFIVLTSADGDSRLPVLGEVDDGGFVFPLYIDNRECEAVIDAPSIATVGADPECGFLRFEAGDTVTLDFHALQPHTDYGAPPTDRATFEFRLRRGANLIRLVTGETAAGSVGDWSGDHDGNFHADFTTGQLLGSCKQAALAEILRVYAKATNGWRRLHEYDARTEWAFALTPKSPGGTDTSGS